MKIILSYSGGLDTSIMIPWLKENYKSVYIIAFYADIGQGEDIDKIRKRAISGGCDKVIIKDLKEEFVREYIFKALSAGAVYQGKYFLSTALSRPLIAKELVKLAKEYQADKIAHGATAKGNDQIRFEVSIGVLDKDIEVIAPARQWQFKSREEEINYAAKKNIPVDASQTAPYSIDKNLWGVSIECGILEDINVEPPEDIYQLTTSPKNAPDNELYLEIYFEEGIPKKVNNKEYSCIDIINYLNKVGGEVGVGRVDMIEDRVIGLKSREVYEVPAAFILYTAHEALESLVLDRDIKSFKELVGRRYSELIYQGLWYSQLRYALDKFIEESQKRVTGCVKVKLYKGNVTVVGLSSPYSLYKRELISYSGSLLLKNSWAEGFIKFYQLPYIFSNK